ncbi:MAG TPA: WG repeat-containing protein [Pyrinomonadaceae bacterium]|nr:WG repeat-containing protein [Pyrinomonadaceae bacterium]
MRTRIFTTVAILLFSAGSWAQSADDRYPFVRDSKVGFIDYQGREVIPPRFSAAGDTAHFENGLAPVFEGGKGSGYIDPSGKFVIGPTQVWGWGRPFHEDIAGVLIWNQQRNRPGWIDRSGKIVFSGMGEEGRYFASGLMSMAGPSGKWGFVNKDFQFVIEPRFDWAWEFSEGLAEVTVNHKSGFIDPSGKIVVPLKYDMVFPFQNGLAAVRRDVQVGTQMTMHGEQPKYRYQYGYIDHEGNEVIPLQFEEATYFSEGYAMAVPSNFKLYGVIDKQGHFVHEPEFESAGAFHDGLAPACVHQKCGYVDTAGAWIVPAAYETARNFWHGLASVSWKTGDYGYISKTGKVVWRSTDQPKSAP